MSIQNWLDRLAEDAMVPRFHQHHGWVSVKTDAELCWKIVSMACPKKLGSLYEWQRWKYWQLASGYRKLAHRWMVATHRRPR